MLDHLRARITPAQRDLALRTFWTGVAAVAGYLLPVLLGLPYWWVPLATPAATAALVWLRQRAGHAGAVEATATDTTHLRRG